MDCKLILIQLVISISSSYCYQRNTMESPTHVCSEKTVVITCPMNSMRIVILQSAFNYMKINDCYDLTNYQPAEPSDCDKDLQTQLSKYCNGYSNCKYNITEDNSLADCGRQQTVYTKYLCIAKKNTFAFCNQHISKEFGYILSPNYPKFYVSSQNCTSTIKAEAGQVITFEILDLDIKAARIIQEKRFKHEKEITECTDKLVLSNQTNELTTICSQDSKNQRFVFKAHPLIIRFDTEDEFNHNRGFLARYTIDGCPSLKQLKHGQISQDELRAKLTCNDGYVFADSHKKFKDLQCKGFNWDLPVNQCVLSSEVIPLGDNQNNNIYSSQDKNKKLNITNIIFIIAFVLAFLTLNLVLLAIFFSCRKKKQRELDNKETTAPLTSLSSV